MAFSMGSAYSCYTYEQPTITQLFLLYFIAMEYGDVTMEHCDVTCSIVKDSSEPATKEHMMSQTNTVVLLWNTVMS